MSEKAKQDAAVVWRCMQDMMDVVGVKSWRDMDSLGALDTILDIENALDVNLPINELEDNSAGEFVRTLMRRIHPEVEESVYMTRTSVGQTVRGNS